MSEDEAATIGQRLSEPQPLLALLQKHDGLIILGDPGAGKTTFLKYLALRLARGEGAALGLGRRLPVLLPLSAYANAMAEKDMSLTDFLATYYRDQGIDLPVGPLLSEALAQGGALLLLDGLDEVRDLSLRHTVIERFINFFAYQRRRGNKFVLTSRIVGYREGRPSPIDGLAECTLVDFDSEEIEQFIVKWTSALEQAAQGKTAVAQQDAAHEKAELLDAVQRNPGVGRLAANPLLLTILALMKRQGVALPDRRVELYEQYVRVLLKHWNLARGLGRSSAHDLDVVETVRVLASLALWMHETSPGVGLVKREALRRKLETIYAARGAAQPQKAARQLLADAHQYAGLLVERGQGTFGFIHLTFQEYLAAVAIGQMGQSTLQPVVEKLAAHVSDDNWHEVTLLTIGYIGIIQQRDVAAGDVLLKFIEMAPGEPGAAVALAGEAAADAWPGGITPYCKQQVTEILLQTMLDDRQVQPLRRAAVGDVLARLGDPRPDVCGREPALIGIPVGLFLMGDEKVEIEIKQPFAIARYPITNAQYRFFVKDGGYTTKWQRCWTKAGLEWLHSNGQTAPRFWHDPERSLANRPVVGVTWYEAVAYATWLRETSSKPYRLPTEAEWERAARHSDGRQYPWGETWREDATNYKNTEVGTTTAVGIFPAGAAQCGTLDMSGNIWEWCQTRWRDENRNEYSQPYQQDDRETVEGGDSVWRVMRGGAYNSSKNALRCASRFRGLPDYGNSYGVGFRVVLSPFSLP